MKYGGGWKVDRRTVEKTFVRLVVGGLLGFQCSVFVRGKGAKTFDFQNWLQPEQIERQNAKHDHGIISWLRAKNKNVVAFTVVMGPIVFNSILPHIS